jgi:hypothetical protein
LYCDLRFNNMGENDMEFWNTEELRKEFTVVASFYQKEILKQMYQFRNHALIIRKGFAEQEHPDAVIVMANPGSCSPIDRNYNPPIIQNEVGSLPYVEVTDDPTQRQLMRLMKLIDWNVVSILNLSDICSGNMNDFTEKLSQIENYFHNHTIFSSARDIEREYLLQNPHTKIVLAWGKDSRIEKLVKKACSAFPKEKHLFGLKYSDPKWGVRHPNPMIKSSCIKWLEEMYLQLKQYDAQSQIATTDDRETKSEQ